MYVKTNIARVQILRDQTQTKHTCEYRHVLELQLRLNKHASMYSKGWVTLILPTVTEKLEVVECLSIYKDNFYLVIDRQIRHTCGVLPTLLKAVGSLQSLHLTCHQGTLPRYRRRL